MFNNTYNFALIQTEIDSIFLPYSTNRNTGRSDAEYALYNRLRKERYDRQDAFYRRINMFCACALIMCVILLIIK